MVPYAFAVTHLLHAPQQRAETGEQPAVFIPKMCQCPHADEQSAAGQNVVCEHGNLLVCMVLSTITAGDTLSHEGAA